MRDSRRGLGRTALLRTAGVLALCTAIANASGPRSVVPPSGDEVRPNIVLIVADDLGFSDLGYLGGEIRTPHLDALARRGITLKQFRASPACSPTRAMLMTGVDHHRSGFGTMREMVAQNQYGRPGYETRLSRSRATIAEVLRQVGYRTIMAGKWHLGYESADDPAARGFDRSFAMLHWGSGNFAGERSRVPEHVPSRIGEIPFRDGEHDFTLNGRPVESLPEGFFSSDAYVDFVVESIRAGDGSRPFFAYLAFNAPHVPIQVPDAWLDRYAGRYVDGPAATRTRRIESARKLGLVPVTAAPSPMRPGEDAWEKLPAETRDRQTRTQEVYAAMVEHMDTAVGRLIEALRQDGTLDRTIIIFLSDNGAAANETTPGSWYTDWINTNFDNSRANLGRRNSELGPGRFWAQVGGAPFRGWKLSTYEGGIRVPFIAAGPGIESKGRIANASTHVLDVVPTMLEVAALRPDALRSVGGREFVPEGRSLKKYLAGGSRSPHRADAVFSFELDGSRAVIQGRWKAVLSPIPRGSGAWELFDLDSDPGESRDISAQYPERVASLSRAWSRYAETHGVILPDRRLIDW